jgi:hypothetical protein
MPRTDNSAGAKPFGPVDFRCFRNDGRRTAARWDHRGTRRNAAGRSRSILEQQRHAVETTDRVHHVAFRAVDDADQAEMARMLVETHGQHPSEQKDRNYDMVCSLNLEAHRLPL